MYKAWKRASASIFITVALILLSAPMSPARANDTRDVRKDDVGMSVKAGRGNGGIVGKVVDVANNGDVTIGLRDTDRDVTVRGGRVHINKDRVVFEGTEDELYRMASNSGDRRYRDRGRGYYDDRDRDNYRDRDRRYNDRYDRDRDDYNDRDRGEDRDNFSLKDLFSPKK